MRRLADQVVLTSMRPPLLPELLNRPTRKTVDLTGKRILLTGASSGIGEAAAEKLARRGATVVVGGAPPGPARRPRRPRITGAGGDASAHVCDLADLDAVDELVAKVEQELGGIDILINNAGRSIRRPLAESLDRWHDVERTMTLNYYSPLRLIRGLAPGMLARGDGHIINVSTWGVLSESSPLFARLQRLEGGAVRGQPGHRNRMGRRRRAFDDAVLPAGEDADDRADAGLRRPARADGRGSRGLDDHRRTHRPVRIAPTNRRHRPRDQQHRPGCRRHDHEAPADAAQRTETR